MEGMEVENYCYVSTAGRDERRKNKLSHVAISVCPINTGLSNQCAATPVSILPSL